MKRKVAKILCVFIALFSSTLPVLAQDHALRIEFQASPFFSWYRSNDNLVLRNGGGVGLKLGTMAEFYFKDTYSLTTGIGLSFHETGEFLYEIGGNFLPHSELSDPLLQTGDKPLPDGTTIRYNLQYVELPFGMKFKTNESGNVRYFVEAPVFNFSFLTRARADIETPDMTYEDENVYKDMSVFNFFWGLGGGFEYSFSENNALVVGLFYQRSLIDFTDDNGYRSIPNPDEDPNDPGDDYYKQTEDSRAIMSNMVLKLGIIF